MVTVKNTASTISALRSQRFLQARAALKKAVDVLVEKYNVSKIMLIGSLLDRERFGFHSDIDLCVEGLPDKLYFKAVGELLLTADEFEIDIIPFENLPQNMKDLMKRGKVIYEKG
jgi:predicted nucleotidyltransferase